MSSPPVPHHTPRRLGLLSTYPPRLCGLATFAAALESALVAGGARVDVVRVIDGDDLPSMGRSSVVELLNDAPASVRRTVAVLNRCDVAIVQHEYGIFGGTDGDEVITILKELDVPAIVTLHTVPSSPTAGQRAVLETVCELAARVVVMTESASDRLLTRYRVDASKVATVRHGATLPSTAGGPGLAGEARRERSPRRPPELLTWGLLGPGKGIEHVIDALELLDDLPTRPRYTVAGVTHPKVFLFRGDEYRESLVRRAWSNGVARSVTFDDSYRTLPELTSFVASASVVVLPYDSRDQVTSGVLVDAIAAGRPMIATEFPHAVEVLRSGAGLTVPHEDPVAMAAAIRAVLSDPHLLATMAAEALRLAPSYSWSAVAADYTRLVDQVVEPSSLVAM